MAVIHPVSKILLTPAFCLSGLLVICQGHRIVSGQGALSIVTFLGKSFFLPPAHQHRPFPAGEALTAGAPEQARPPHLRRTRNMSTNQATAVREFYYQNVTYPFSECWILSGILKLGVGWGTGMRRISVREIFFKTLPLASSAMLAKLQ